MSWSSVKTEGVVLTSYPFREADRRYQILTPDHGKVQFVGRGAQKGKAKLASHLEPFAIIDVEYIRGRRSTTVISVDRRHTFKNISKNLERRLLAQTSLTLLDRYTREQDEDQTLYQMLVDWLQFLDRDEPLSSTRSTFLLGGFILRLLTRLGYKIELKHCLDCKELVFPLAFRWHSNHGGLVCTTCIKERPEDWFAARNASEEVIKLIRFARDSKYLDLLRPPLAGETVEEFAKIVHDLIMFHLPGRWEQPFWTGILADYVLEMPEEKV